MAAWHQLILAAMIGNQQLGARLSFAVVGVTDKVGVVLQPRLHAPLKPSRSLKPSKVIFQVAMLRM
jgi:hypothetical protein